MRRQPLTRASMFWRTVFILAFCLSAILLSWFMVDCVARMRGIRLADPSGASSEYDFYWWVNLVLPLVVFLFGFRLLANLVQLEHVDKPQNRLLWAIEWLRRAVANEPLPKWAMPSASRLRPVATPFPLTTEARERTTPEQATATPSPVEPEAGDMLISDDTTVVPHPLPLATESRAGDIVDYAPVSPTPASAPANSDKRLR